MYLVGSSALIDGYLVYMALPYSEPEPAIHVGSHDGQRLDAYKKADSCRLQRRRVVFHILHPIINSQ